MMTKPKKLFIVRKYVMAENAAQACKLEKNHPADDVWLDDDWKKSQPNAGANVMGFVPRAKSKKQRRNHG